jgi:hypothetical protein
MFNIYKYSVELSIFLALEGLPIISQSIRGKPAEKIIKSWYTGEFEAYEPTIID